MPLGLLVVVLVALGCGSPRDAPSFPRAGASAEVAEFLGVHPQVTAVVHPRTLAREPMFGWSLVAELERQAEKGPDGPSTATALEFLEKTTRVEAYFATRGAAPGEVLPPRDPGIFGEWAQTIVYALVLRGTFGDPRRLVSRSGKPMFVEPSRLPSGVIELQERGARHEGRARAFYLPDGTWVYVDARTAVRARAFFARRPTFPASVSVDEDAMGAAFLGPEVVEALKKQAVDDPAVEVLRHVKGIGLVARGAPRRSLEIVLHLGGEEAAEHEEGFVLSALEREKATHCSLMRSWCDTYLGGMTVRRDGATVILTIPG